jgi:hypothetical protein
LTFSFDFYADLLAEEMIGSVSVVLSYIRVSIIEVVRDSDEAFLDMKLFISTAVAVPSKVVNIDCTKNLSPTFFFWSAISLEEISIVTDLLLSIIPVEGVTLYILELLDLILKANLLIDSFEIVKVLVKVDTDVSIVSVVGSKFNLLVLVLFSSSFLLDRSFLSGESFVVILFSSIF